MSYELYLRSPRLTSETFGNYFSDRRGFDADGWYANERTGVYFGFDFVEKAEEDDPDAPEFFKHPHAEFNLNFFRPHVFGLEAEQELSAFVREFDCSVFDPQLDGMGDGTYLPEEFLRGWNHGNELGYRVMTRDGTPESIMLADDNLIERVWRWNLNLPDDRAASSGEHFLPQIMWASARKGGEVLAFAIWCDDVPTAIPDCATHVLLSRKPRRGFLRSGVSKTKGLEYKLLPLGEVAGQPACEWRDEENGRVLFAPADLRMRRGVIQSFRDGFSDFDEIATGFPADHILNASFANQ